MHKHITSTKLLSQLKALGSRRSSGDVINTSPWFDILLFKTQLRFRLPKPTPKHRIQAGFSNQDERPFVNTRSKQHYRCEDDMGFYYLPYYQCSWQFSPKGLFTKPDAEITFTLTGASVTQPQEKHFPDIRDTDTCKRWLEHFYRDEKTFYNQFYLQQHDNGLLEIIDTPRSKAVESPYPISVKFLQINGQQAFTASPSPDHIDYWFPFSRTDMAHFSFSATTLKPISNDRKTLLLKDITHWVSMIVNTVQLTNPTTDQKNPGIHDPCQNRFWTVATQSIKIRSQ